MRAARLRLPAARPAHDRARVPLVAPRATARRSGQLKYDDGDVEDASLDDIWIVWDQVHAADDVLGARCRSVHDANSQS